jgi:hypothetical protein
MLSTESWFSHVGFPQAAAVEAASVDEMDGYPQAFDGSPNGGLDRPDVS